MYIDFNCLIAYDLLARVYVCLRTFGTWRLA